MSPTPRIQLRLDPDERARWEDAAKRASLDLSSFIRTVMATHLTKAEQDTGR